MGSKAETFLLTMTTSTLVVGNEVLKGSALRTFGWTKSPRAPRAALVRAAIGDPANGSFVAIGESRVWLSTGVERSLLQDLEPIPAAVKALLAETDGADDVTLEAASCEGLELDDMLLVEHAMVGDRVEYPLAIFD